MYLAKGRFLLILSIIILLNNSTYSSISKIQVNDQHADNVQIICNESSATPFIYTDFKETNYDLQNQIAPRFFRYGFYTLMPLISAYKGSCFHVEHNFPFLSFMMFQVENSSPETGSDDLNFFYQKPLFSFIFFLVGIGAMLLIILFREKESFKNRKKLEKKIEKRTRQLEMQKEELQAQIEFTTIQNHKIEKQNKELEDHRKNLEELVMKRTRDLEAAKKRAEESDRLKSAFLANMSHEIRTPMNAIVGFSNILYEEDLPREEQKELLNHISDNSNNLLKLIENIIDISKIESKELKFKFKPVNINQLIDEIYQEYRNVKELNDKGIRFRVVKQYERRNIYLNTDSWRLRQILANLIDNAMKFTVSGEIEFGYLMVQKVPKRMFKFYVHDTGIGMTREQQEHIFEIFRKVNNNEKFNKGTGIGLSICKKLVQGMDGDLWVESTLGGGSTFYFTIPDKKTENDPSQRVDSSELSNGYDWSDKMLLLIGNGESDDLYTYLKKTLINVVQTDGYENIDQIIEEHRKHLNVVIVSNKHTIEDCRNDIKRIRKENEKLPIIAVVDENIAGKDNRIDRSGFTEIISKQNMDKELIRKIGQYIS